MGPSTQAWARSWGNLRFPPQILPAAPAMAGEHTSLASRIASLFALTRAQQTVSGKNRDVAACEPETRVSPGEPPRRQAPSGAEAGGVGAGRCSRHRASRLHTPPRPALPSGSLHRCPVPPPGREAPPVRASRWRTTRPRAVDRVHTLCVPSSDSPWCVTCAAVGPSEGTGLPAGAPGFLGERPSPSRRSRCWFLTRIQGALKGV